MTGFRRLSRLSPVKMGVIADIHGNDVALRAVLEDADGFIVDRQWALGIWSCSARVRAGCPVTDISARPTLPDLRGPL